MIAHCFVVSFALGLREAPAKDVDLCDQTNGSRHNSSIGVQGMLCTSCNPIMPWIPGIDSVGRGFDAYTGESTFFQQAISFSWGGDVYPQGASPGNQNVYAVPAEVDSVINKPCTETSSTSSVSRTADEYRTKLAASFGLSGALDSLSGSFGYSNVKQTLRESSSYGSVVTTEQKIRNYQITLRTSTLLNTTQQFQDMVAKLPVSYNASDASVDLFTQLIAHYGTHYISSAKFGGVATQEMAVNEEFSKSNSVETIGMNANLRFKWLQLSFSRTTSTSDASEAFSRCDSSSSTLLGGDPNDLSGWLSWKNTVKAAPAMIASQVVPISNLVRGRRTPPNADAIADAIDTAIAAHAKPSPECVAKRAEADELESRLTTDTDAIAACLKQLTDTPLGLNCKIVAETWGPGWTSQGDTTTSQWRFPGWATLSSCSDPVPLEDCKLGLGQSICCEMDTVAVLKKQDNICPFTMWGYDPSTHWPAYSRATVRVDPESIRKCFTDVGRLPPSPSYLNPFNSNGTCPEGTLLTQYKGNTTADGNGDGNVCSPPCSGGGPDACPHGADGDEYAPYCFTPAHNALPRCTLSCSLARECPNYMTCIKDPAQTIGAGVCVFTNRTKGPPVPTTFTDQTIQPQLPPPSISSPRTCFDSCVPEKVKRKEGKKDCCFQSGGRKDDTCPPPAKYRCGPNTTKTTTTTVPPKTPPPPPPSCKGDNGILAGLESLGAGFDAVLGEPLGSMVNVDTCQHGKIYADPFNSTNQFRVPDQIYVFDSTRGQTSVLSKVFYSYESYAKDLSWSAGVSVSKGAWSGNAAVNRVKSYFEKSNESGAFLETSCSIGLYTGVLPPPQFLALSDDFIHDVNALPEKYDLSTVRAFKDFLNQWGTHYINAATFGGYAKMTTTVKASYSSVTDSKEIEAQASIRYMNYTVSAGANATGTSNQGSGSTSFSEFSMSNATFYGGDETHAGEEQPGDALLKWPKWRATIRQNPVPTKFKTRSIRSLVEVVHPAAAEALGQAIAVRMGASSSPCIFEDQQIDALVAMDLSKRPSSACALRLVQPFAGMKFTGCCQALRMPRCAPDDKTDCYPFTTGFIPGHVTAVSECSSLYTVCRKVGDVCQAVDGKCNMCAWRADGFLNADNCLGPNPGDKKYHEFSYIPPAASVTAIGLADCLKKTPGACQ